MKKWRNIIGGMLAAGAVMLGVMQPVCAAEQLKVSIPVKITISGNVPEGRTDFTVRLKADQADDPMPADAKNGSYVMCVKGGETKNIPEITYLQTGTYTYLLEQVPDGDKAWIYDLQTYQMKVIITNKEDGTGLEATALLCRKNQNEKVSEAEFQNSYQKAAPKTGDLHPIGESVLFMALGFAGIAETVRRRRT